MTSDQTIPVNTLYSSVSATPALSNLVNQSQGSSDPVWDAIQNHINQNQQPAQGMTAKDVGKVISALPDNHPAIQQLSNSITPQQNPHPYLSMLQGLSGALGAYANAQTPSTGAALIAGANAFTPAMQQASNNYIQQARDNAMQNLYKSVLNPQLQKLGYGQVSGYVNPDGIKNLTDLMQVQPNVQKTQASAQQAQANANKANAEANDETKGGKLTKLGDLADTYHQMGLITDNDYNYFQQNKDDMVSNDYLSKMIDTRTKKQGSDSLQDYRNNMYDIAEKKLDLDTKFKNHQMSYQDYQLNQRDLNIQIQREKLKVDQQNANTNSQSKTFGQTHYKDPMTGQWKPNTIPKINNVPELTTDSLPSVPSGRIAVKSPDGKIGHIPQNQLQKALKQGFQQVQ